MMEGFSYYKDLYHPIEIITNSDGSVSKLCKLDKMEEKDLGKVEKKYFRDN